MMQLNCRSGHTGPKQHETIRVATVGIVIKIVISQFSTSLPKMIFRSIAGKFCRQFQRIMLILTTRRESIKFNFSAAKRNEFCRGFTLTELIVVMVIIGIAVLIALPSFKSFTRNSNVVGAVNDLVTSLNYARSEAVTRKVNVTVCKSNDQANCDTSVTGWEQGWIIFCDVDAAGDVDVGTDTILRVYDPLKGGGSMIGGGNIADRLTYANTGFFAGLFNGTITVTSGASSFKIITNNNGRVRTEK